MITLLFFLSGAAALMYQVVWVRALTLVFGGSHLAVTAVLSTFMAGLAIGGYAIGRWVDRVERPLRLYGLLELGIAGSALAAAGLIAVYPDIYVMLARGRDDSTLYLTSVRLLFSFLALIVPTIFMGGTLPVLSRFVSDQPEGLRRHLSFLYGFNTLGAVSGALLTGFVLLRLYAVSATLVMAVALNVAIGLASLALQRRYAAGAGMGDAVVPAAAGTAAGGDSFRARLVLWGIGLSGFCALGYEVLWTRVLTVAIGASVYGFTLILVAFLTGIAFGSKAYGLLVRFPRIAPDRSASVAAWFGVTQVLIGVAALVVTVYLRDLPALAARFETYLVSGDSPSFAARAWASFFLAFVCMVLPAALMGAAFPMAGDLVARERRAVGRAVGAVLASNTVGALLGAAVSGLLMIRAFGIERSLQILTVVNVGVGLVVLASLLKARWLSGVSALATLGAVTFLGINTNAARVWDRDYFAIFRSNQPEAFRTPELVREAVENTDVLFYAEGVESIVSVIRVKGGEQAFVTNGRVEASSHLQALQVQYTLGHLPMLLNPAPRNVLVVGMGSGMTAGATTVHPTAERVTLVELEPQVTGVARTFAEYNHHVLDSPKLQIVINDGRNFLMTTDRTFDVITADPIHPWFRGAGYLYTSEYFQLAAQRLNPRGVLAQWLPFYELTPQDLASVVRTIQLHFAHTLLWLTHYDSVIVASNAPFEIDEAALQRRIAEPGIREDLTKVAMGTAHELLGYFVMGTGGMQRFSRNGTVNTDDRLYLEFSAPFSIASPPLMAENVKAATAHRENLLPYLAPAADPAAREAQRERCDLQLAAGRVGDRALALYLAGRGRDPAFLRLLHELGLEHPWYAPGRFLAGEHVTALALEPQLLRQSRFELVSEDGEVTAFELSAVLVPVSSTRASIMFVDNRARVVYGQWYVNDYARDGLADRLALEVMGAVRAAYEGEAAAARQQRRALPLAARTLERIKSVIASKVARAQVQS